MRSWQVCILPLLMDETQSLPRHEILWGNTLKELPRKLDARMHSSQAPLGLLRDHYTVNYGGVRVEVLTELVEPMT